MNIDVTIGWTNSDRDNRIFTDGYSSFSDGYRPGAEQVTRTLTVDLGDTEQPVDRLVEMIAEAAFEATNSPAPQMKVAQALRAALDADGYRGEGAHYSLSVGDTVTVGEVTLACDRFGWKRVVIAPAVV